MKQTVTPKAHTMTKPRLRQKLHLLKQSSLTMHIWSSLYMLIMCGSFLVLLMINTWVTHLPDFKQFELFKEQETLSKGGNSKTNSSQKHTGVISAFWIFWGSTLYAMKLINIRFTST